MLGADRYCLLRTSVFQSLRLRAFPINAPMKTASIKPPKNAKHVKLESKFGEMEFTTLVLRNKKKTVTHDPRQRMTVMNESMLMTRPRTVRRMESSIFSK